MFKFSKLGKHQSGDTKHLGFCLEDVLVFIMPGLTKFNWRTGQTFTLTFIRTEEPDKVPQGHKHLSTLWAPDEGPTICRNLHGTCAANAVP